MAGKQARNNTMKAFANAINGLSSGDEGYLTPTTADANKLAMDDPLQAAVLGAANLHSDVSSLKSAINFDKTATPGYILRATNEGTGQEWAQVGTPTDEQTATAVSAWLTAHPEATTTVEDGSITETKLHTSLKNQIDKIDGIEDEISYMQCNRSYPFDKDKSCTYSAPTTKNTESNWACAIVECQEGDVFNVKGYGGNNTRLWIFSDSNGTALTYSNASVSASNYLRIVAPANAAHLSCNTNYTLIAGELIKGEVSPYVTPQDYGAKADGVTDDTDAVQAALTAADTGCGAIYFPAGTYLVTETITVGDRLIFDMNPKAVIKAGAEMETVLSIVSGAYTTQKPEFRNIVVNGNSLAEHGIVADKLSMSNTVSISGMTVEYCTDTGIIFTDCQGAIAAAICSQHNGGDGIHILGCNGLIVFKITASYNDGDGILFARSQLCQGSPSVYGLSVENNGGVGIKFGQYTGIVRLYSGHLEGNDDIPLYFDTDAKCFVEGFRIFWGSSTWLAEKSYCYIDSSFVTLRSFELQAGDNATRVPNILNNKLPLIDDIQLAIMRQYSTINEKLFANIITGGDMDRNSGIDVYSADKTYKSTDLVDSEAGRTYSLKCVITNASGFDIAILNTTGFTVGQLYKITCRIYYQGSNTMSLRLKIRDNDTNTTYYGTTQSVTNNEWNELTGYFYAMTSNMIKFFVGIDQDKPSVGDIFYLSTYFAQPAEKAKIAVRQLGNTYLYNDIEPDTFN